MSKKRGSPSDREAGQGTRDPQLRIRQLPDYHCATLA